MRPYRLLVMAALLLSAPSALAHTSYFTPDGTHRVVVGNLGEPVYTFGKTGLDLCFQTNTTERAPVAIDPFAFTATLIAPDNHTMTQPLKAQFGRAGCYTFEEGYILTQPGQYVLHLQGTLGGAAIDTRINVAGPIGDSSEITFPDEGIPATAALADKIERLETMQRFLWAVVVLVALGAVAGVMWARKQQK